MLWLAPGKDHGNPGPQGDANWCERLLGRRRVLIVEDERLVALDIERIISEEGYDVIAVVDNERDAIVECERLDPDVILMDIRLREGDGVSAAKAIQARRHVPVIFISANFDAGTLTRIGELRAAVMLRKPFLDCELLNELGSALGRAG
jgi:CheY-like chemotaxis protein